MKKLITKKKIKEFISILQRVTKQSSDKTKVGCLLLRCQNLQDKSKDRVWDIISSGHNRVPHFNLPFRDKLDNTHNYVIHAEEEAILKSMPSLDPNVVMFISYAPCEHCAALISIYKKIKEVYYLELLNGNDKGVKLLESLGIKCKKISNDTK
ncbi:hypothetical protein [Campylobacter fetus]|uniref:hypothetical protein n=1 Tax=Campylobacter fetus TaxID=196 RepID=UPI001000CAF8|nr:hypothetical protein [Campylobacter fetus]RUT50963.1 hypothetical protein BWK67_00120 [Campylobacter fetus]RUT51691.1 hypothetical protein BWK51_00120 [Campylobacter fetus]